MQDDTTTTPPTPSASNAPATHAATVAQKLEEARKGEAQGLKYFWDVQKYDEQRQARAFDRVFGVDFDEIAFGRKHGRGEFRRQLRYSGGKGVLLNIDFATDTVAEDPAAPAPVAAAPDAVARQVQALAAQVEALAGIVRNVTVPRQTPDAGISLADVLRILETRPAAPAVAPAANMADVVKEVATAMTAMQSMMPKPQPVAEILETLRAFKSAAGEFTEPAPSRSDDGLAAFAPVLQQFMEEIRSNRAAPVQQQQQQRPAAPLPPAPARAPTAAPSAPAAPQKRVRLPFPGADQLAAFFRSHIEQVRAFGTVPADQRTNIIETVADQLADEIEIAGGDPIDVAETENVVLAFTNYAPDLRPFADVVGALFEAIRASAEEEPPAEQQQEKEGDA